MPSISLISFLRAAVGLRLAAKKLSSWVSWSGVTRDRLRFSRVSRPLPSLGPARALDRRRRTMGGEASSLRSRSVGSSVPSEGGLSGFMRGEAVAEREVLLEAWGRVPCGCAITVWQTVTEMVVRLYSTCDSAASVPAKELTSSTEGRRLE